MFIDYPLGSAEGLLSQRVGNLYHSVRLVSFIYTLTGKFWWMLQSKDGKMTVIK